MKRSDAYRSQGDFKMAAQDYVNHGNALIKREDYDKAIMWWGLALFICFLLRWWAVSERFLYRLYS